MSPLVSGKSAFLHDGYIGAIENCCAPMVHVVKHTLFAIHVASSPLGALFNMILATHIMSLLLGTSFNMKF